MLLILRRLIIYVLHRLIIAVMFPLLFLLTPLTSTRSASNHRHHTPTKLGDGRRRAERPNGALQKLARFRKHLKEGLEVPWGF